MTMETQASAETLEENPGEVRVEPPATMERPGQGPEPEPTP